MKIIRIEPVPTNKLKVNIKRQKNVVDESGKPMVYTTANNKEVYKTELVQDNLVQIPGTTTFFKPAISRRGLKTGLDFYIDNPYKNETAYFPEWGERVLKDKAKVLFQHALEYKHKVALDYYTGVTAKLNRKDSNEEYFYNKQESTIPLRGGVLFLNLDIPNDEVKFHALRVSDIVAPSLGSIKNYPKALYYIVQEEDKSIAIKTQREINKVRAKLEELMESKTKGVLVKMAKALDIRDAPINTDDLAYSYLDSRLDDKSARNEDFINLFNSMYNLYKTKHDKDRFEAYVKLYDYMTADLIGVNGGEYRWRKPATEHTASQIFTYAGRDIIVDKLLLSPENKEDAELLRMLYEDKVRNREHI